MAHSFLGQYTPKVLLSRLLEKLQCKIGIIGKADLSTVSLGDHFLDIYPAANVSNNVADDRDYLLRLIHCLRQLYFVSRLLCRFQQSSSAELQRFSEKSLVFSEPACELPLLEGKLMVLLAKAFRRIEHFLPAKLYSLELSGKHMHLLLHFGFEILRLVCADAIEFAVLRLL